MSSTTSPSRFHRATAAPSDERFRMRCSLSLLGRGLPKGIQAEGIQGLLIDAISRRRPPVRSTRRRRTCPPRGRRHGLLAEPCGHRNRSLARASPRGGSGTTAAWRRPSRQPRAFGREALRRAGLGGGGPLRLTHGAFPRMPGRHSERPATPRRPDRPARVGGPVRPRVPRRADGGTSASIARGNGAERRNRVADGEPARSRGTGCSQRIGQCA